MSLVRRNPLPNQQVSRKRNARVTRQDTFPLPLILQIKFDIYRFYLYCQLIVPSVTSIINESIASNAFPMEWKTAEVIPVLKGGDHEKPNNYRPISLLPVLSSNGISL